MLHQTAPGLGAGPYSLQRKRGPRRLPVEALFWSKVNRSAAEDHWTWLGALDAYGFGVFSYWMPDGRCRTRRAWRWAAELLYGEVPAGVRPCPAPACTNPGHLRWPLK